MLDWVLNTQMNTASKYLLNNYWWALESIEIKRCISMKWIMLHLNQLAGFYMMGNIGRLWLNMHIFITFYNCSFLFLLFQTLRFFIQAIINFKGTAIAKKKCWLHLSLNRIFVLLEIFCRYLEAVIVKGVFSTLSNAIELFAKLANSF